MQNECEQAGKETTPWNRECVVCGNQWQGSDNDDCPICVPATTAQATQKSVHDRYLCMDFEDGSFLETFILPVSGDLRIRFGAARGEINEGEFSVPLCAAEAIAEWLPRALAYYAEECVRAKVAD